MTDIRSIQRPATAVSAPVATVLLALSFLGLLSACVADAAGRQAPLTSHEIAQHDRCVALLRPMLHGQPVRSTSFERGPLGLDYVWINAEIHDDADDIERRVAKGARVGGHCQFDEGGASVHLHTYALDVSDEQDAPAGDYRFVAAQGERVASSHSADR